MRKGRKRIAMKDEFTIEGLYQWSEQTGERRLNL
jgi:hypothetical protein